MLYGPKLHYQLVMVILGFVVLSMQLMLSAFLASAAGSSDLIDHILPDRLDSIPYPKVDDAKIVWSRSHDQSPPPPPVTSCQKAWDMSWVQQTFNTLLDNALDPRSHARLLAAAET